MDLRVGKMRQSIDTATRTYSSSATLKDKWTIERLLGVGGMAAVYAARHRNASRGAIKAR